MAWGPSISSASGPSGSNPGCVPGLHAGKPDGRSAAVTPVSSLPTSPGAHHSLRPHRLCCHPPTPTVSGCWPCPTDPPSVHCPDPLSLFLGRKITISSLRTFLPSMIVVDAQCFKFFHFALDLYQDKFLEFSDEKKKKPCLSCICRLL